METFFFFLLLVFPLLVSAENFLVEIEEDPAAHQNSLHKYSTVYQAAFSLKETVL